MTVKTAPYTGTGTADVDVEFDTGVRTAATQRVTVATNDLVPISAAALPLPTGAATSALQGGGLPAALGAGGGVKVDGSGTALPVSLASLPALTAGTAGIGKLTANSGVDIGDVDVTSVVPGTAATNLGKAEDAAHTSGDVGVMALGVQKAAAAALGAEGDYEPMQFDAYGRLHVAPLLVDPAAQKSVAYNATAQKTGDIILSPTAGKRMAITSVVIGTYGTTAARLILWGGADGDTTYSAGTDQAVFIASFVPSASAAPGAVFTPAVPVFLTADHNLMLTSSAALSVDITVYYYEV